MALKNPLFLLLCFLCLSTSSLALNTSTLQTSLSSFNCNSTPYPQTCLRSLKLSLSLNMAPNILTLILQSLNAALSQGLQLSNLLLNTNLVEKQRGTIQDCQELHQITLSSLQKTISILSLSDLKKLVDAKVYLSAALTNKDTCLEGLQSASGPNKPSLVNTIVSTYAHISIALSILSEPVIEIGIGVNVGGGSNCPEGEVLTVAPDGSGNFTLIQDAINFAPNNSTNRTFIFVKKGVYRENVDIPIWKTNIVLIGDGRDETVITANRSNGSGWSTFRSATFGVSAEGFMARDITFENTAGPQNQQAVALRVNADHAALYRCKLDGFQDTLYAHSFRQFYRECDIYGTIDYIFGNAAAVFQHCNIISKLPMPGQFTVITAQSRQCPTDATGISIQRCSILATDELLANSSSVQSYLGRPWQNYSTAVIMESYIEGFIEPAGWHNWGGDDQGLDTLYYGEYENYGPGSSTDERVTWPGYHVMDYYEASNFTVSQLIAGEEWLNSTFVPYEDGV